MKYPVDVKKVRGIQSKLWERIKGTFNLPKGAKLPPIFGHYGGVFQVGNEQLVIHCDGVGTKVLVAQELNKYDSVGIDAIAMNVNDILCLGAGPLVGVDYVALAKEDDKLMDELVEGLVKGAEQSNCAIIGGETAIVPDLLHDEKSFDLTFTVVGKVRDKIITGEDSQVGDVLIGLESSGLHSNGYTLARKVLDIKKWGKEMLEPTKIYVKPMLELLSKHEVHGMAHITGGAFSKLTRLNKNVGFLLNSMPKLSGIFEELYKSVGDTQEMYRTFNCGIGFVLVVKKEDETKIHEFFKAHSLASHTIGKVVDKPGVFLEHEDKKVELTVK